VHRSTESYDARQLLTHLAALGLPDLNLPHPQQELADLGGPRAQGIRPPSHFLKVLCPARVPVMVDPLNVEQLH